MVTGGTVANAKASDQIAAKSREALRTDTYEPRSLRCGKVPPTTLTQVQPLAAELDHFFAAVDTHSVSINLEPPSVIWT